MNDRPPFGRHNFLVVDDESFSRGIVRRILVGLGAEVQGVADGEAAIDALRKSDSGVHCIITDFNMPKMNGLELLKAIRIGTAGIRRELPVVMLTGHSDTDLLGTALALDANGFIVKPVSQKTLSERLVRVMREPQPIRPALAYKVIQALTLDDILREARAGGNANDTSGSTSPGQPGWSRPVPSGPGQAQGHGASRPRVSPPLPAPRGPEARRTVDTVPENSVLTRDIRTPAGVSLLSAGQVLTRPLIARLKDLQQAGMPNMEIWVKGVSKGSE